MNQLEGDINWYYLFEFCFAASAFVSVIAIVVLCWGMWRESGK